MQISKINKRNENFNLSGDIDTSGITLDPNLLPLYSSRVIEYAKILKAKNGAGKYSDEYYLDYAKGIDNREMQGAYNEIFHKKAAQCDIQDAKWRGYSYEEIIQMKNSGVKIPEEVLLWAEAQLESDVIAYEVISDEASIDDNTTTEEVAGDTNINSLQTKAKFYINKAEDSQENNKQKVEEFETLSNNVTQIKNEKESAYKNALNEIAQLTNELEELDEKNKNGTLTQSEAKRYKELGKIVNTKNNTAVNNMLKNSYEVDEFLSSIDSLNKEVNNNLTLANDIQKTNDDLSNFDRKSNDTSATHNTKGIVYSNMGPLGDLLYGINTTSIEKVALDVRTELETNSNDTLNTINSLENTELANFAKNYTRTVNSLLPQTNLNTNINTNNEENGQQTTEQTNEQTTDSKQNVNNTSTQIIQAPNQAPEDTETTPAQTPADNTTNTTTESDTTEQTTTDNTDKENKAKQNNNQFTVVVGASPAAALAATVISSVSTADLNSKETRLNASSKAAQIDFTKAETDAQNLLKEQKAIEEEHEANMQELEASITNAQNNTEAQDNTVISTPETAQTNIQENTDDNVEAQTTTTTTTTPQGEETQTTNAADIEQANAAIEKEQELSNQITKAFKTSNLSSAKSEKSRTDLETQNSQFRARNLNNQDVAINTIVTGSATTAFGAYNMSIAIPMLQSGITLMLNPFTYALGQTLTTIATEEIIQATAQIATGTAANVAGGVGLAASANASKTINTTNQTLLAAQKSNQDNLKIIQEASQSDLVINESEENNQNNNTNTQNENPETEIAQTTQNIPTTAQNTPQISQPEQNEIQTRITQNSQETEQVNKKTTDANQTISTQTNKVDAILEENTKTSQQLEDKIATLNSGTPNVDEKEDTTGDIQNLQRKLENTSDDSDKFIDEKEETTSEIPVQEEEQITPVDNNSDDTNLLAASATTSANINNATTTDDKATRKLERFNNDSIIESKKKKKKVMAVSAASGGSVKG